MDEVPLITRVDTELQRLKAASDRYLEVHSPSAQSVCVGGVEDDASVYTRRVRAPRLSGVCTAGFWRCCCLMLCSVAAAGCWPDAPKLFSLNQLPLEEYCHQQRASEPQAFAGCLWDWTDYPASTVFIDGAIVRCSLIPRSSVSHIQLGSPIY